MKRIREGDIAQINLLDHDVVVMNVYAAGSGTMGQLGGDIHLYTVVGRTEDECRRAMLEDYNEKAVENLEAEWKQFISQWHGAGFIKLKANESKIYNRWPGSTNE